LLFQANQLLRVFQNSNDNSLFDGALAKDMGEIGFYKLKESINKIVDNTTEKIL
jgi:hypothetical protein